MPDKPDTELRKLNENLREEIKRLKQKGLTLIDINAALNHRLNSHEDNSGNNSIEALADHIAEVVRFAIVSFFEGKATE